MSLSVTRCFWAGDAADYTFTHTERTNREFETTQDHRLDLSWINRSNVWLTLRANYEFFEDLGSPGGASKVGKIDKDTPFVTAQPPRGDAH